MRKKFIQKGTRSNKHEIKEIRIINNKKLIEPYKINNFIIQLYWFISWEDMSITMVWIRKKRVNFTKKGMYFWVDPRKYLCWCYVRKPSDTQNLYQRVTDFKTSMRDKKNQKQYPQIFYYGEESRSASLLSSSLPCLNTSGKKINKTKKRDGGKKFEE